MLYGLPALVIATWVVAGPQAGSGREILWLNLAAAAPSGAMPGVQLLRGSYCTSPGSWGLLGETSSQPVFRITPNPTIIEGKFVW